MCFKIIHTNTFFENIFSVFSYHEHAVYHHFLQFFRRSHKYVRYAEKPIREKRIVGTFIGNGWILDRCAEMFCEWIPHRRYAYKYNDTVEYRRKRRLCAR